MSAFGSSVINKSNRKLAPKASAQRRNRPALSTPALREDDPAPAPFEVRVPEPAEPPPSLASSSQTTQPSEAIPSAGQKRTRRGAHAPDDTAQASPRKSRRIANPSDQRANVTTDDGPIDALVPETVAEDSRNHTSAQVQAVSSLSESHTQVDSASQRQKPTARRNNRVQRDAGGPAQGLPQDVEVVESEQRNGQEQHDVAATPRPTRRPRKAATSSRADTRSAVSNDGDQRQERVTRRTGQSGERETEDASQSLADDDEGASESPPAATEHGTRHRQDEEESTAAEPQQVVHRDAEADRSGSNAGELSDEVNGERDEDPVPRKKRRRRRATPDGAEEHQIDPGTLTMFDLVKDNGRGKKSKLEAEFQEIDWTEVVRRRKEAQARARTEEVNSVARTHQSAEGDGGPSETAPQGPQLKLVNGQIVVDTSSLMVDRHAAARPDDAQPAVEEQDITRRVTSHSWINDNRRDVEDRYRSSNKSDPWSEAATNEFYSALRMFGTDFMMISKMFPGRTRRHIKLKFVREERADPARIKEALVGGSVPMDLQVYCNATGQRTEDYKDPRDLEEELKADEERQRAEIEKQKEEQAEAQRKKQGAAAAKAAAGRHRKTGEKGAGKNRRRRQGGAAAGDAQDSVIETVEL